MIVYTLTCKRDFALASACFRSQVEHLEGLEKLVVLDDGSLESEQKEALSRISPRIDVQSRNNREAMVLERLSRYPQLLAWRNRHPLMLKVLDVVLTSKEDDLLFLDSDIFLFSSTSGLFPEEIPAVCCHDDDHGYSGPLLTLKMRYGRRLFRSCNSGILKFPKNRYDLDLMEDFVSHPSHLVLPGLVEQTLFCLLLGSGETWQTSGNDIHCSFAVREFPTSILGLHLIYSMKQNWKHFVAFRPDREGGTVELNKIQELKLSDIILRKVRRTFEGRRLRGCR